ncbi:uncharacterized protein LOC120989618 [Bufo bufo]|uniref:uncharacterized protein LOC120989618 n=1 Tax=Bufo bufo TaxID=8384 RepID=UPI001ABDB924|nr:uncharacterized protein LOC120989618 [Bufo bufo]
MTWKNRTRSRPGKFQKIILEEAPPRSLMKPSDNYDDIIDMAIQQFWASTEHKNVMYTLCYSDGSRWPKDDFIKEYGNLGNIPEIWKKTFYVGQRLIDTDEVVYMGTVSSLSGSSRPGVVEEEITEEINNVSDFSSAFLCVICHSHLRGKILSQAHMTHCLRILDSNNAETPGKYQKSDKTNASASASTPPAPLIQSEYLPRVPYVEANQIKFNTDMVIGSGSFGSVYIGSYQGTPSAIKKIPLNEQNSDIMHKILVCLRLSHPNIVRFMAAAKTESFVLIANEYIHGASLHTVLHGSENSVIVKK